jgi:3-deoxy-D-manno-octulosonic-acid transferase
LFYKTGISIAANWNSKAFKWKHGRINWAAALASNWKHKPGDAVVWIHCASLGEFEQGRPIMEAIKKQFPQIKLLLTFFSPSGYEIRKNYPGADYVMYLPFDSAGNAKHFLEIVQPRLAIFVKYEFWHYYLQELKTRNTPAILVSGIFRKTQPFFKWYGAFNRNMLQCFTHLFVQDDNSKQLLAAIGVNQNITVAGDTRFDRVLAAARQWKPVENVELFTGNKKIMVAGSSWKEDEDMIAAWFSNNHHNWKLIIAPHETGDANIERLQKQFSSSVLFTELNIPGERLPAAGCLIINTIGHLSKLYKYATVCYVGGGFNKSGHHNILEAAVYGKAVITGPNYQKFKESVELKNEGASFAVNNANELKQIVSTININDAGRKAAAYVIEHAGAVNSIMQWIQEKRLFTNA